MINRYDGKGGLSGRKLALSLLAAMLLLAPACAKDGGVSPKNPVSIEIWHYYSGPQKLAFDSMVSQFNETEGRGRGIAVEAHSKGSVNQLTDKVLEAVYKKAGAERAPDIFAAYADTAYQMDRLGLAAPLEDYLSKKDMEEYIPDYIAEGKLEGGRLKIFPIAKSTEILMLNKTGWDPFARATGTPLSELATIEGVTRAARRYYEWTDSLTAEPGDGKAFFGRDAMANYFLLGAHGLGADIFEVDGASGQVSIRTDEEVMRRLWENYYVPFVSGWFTANGRFRTDDAKTGDLIALVGSTSGAAYFPEKVMVDDSRGYPIEVLALPPPQFEGGKRSMVQQGAGMVVIKSEAPREYAAVRFLRWFTEGRRNMDFSIVSGYMPVKKEANSLDMLDEALGRAGDVPDSLQKTLRVAIGMVAGKEYEMFSNRAFEGGAEARAVLEGALSARAEEDRAEIQRLIAEGTPREDALARYCGEESFQRSFREIRDGLEAALLK